MTRMLIIGDAERAAITAAVERAAAHPMSLETVKELAQAIPQDRNDLTLADRKAALKRPESEHVAIAGGYRASISFEQQPIGLCRHLSVSVDTPGRLPHMLAVGMIAEAFGFIAGAPRHIWVEEFAPGHHAVNVVEPVLPPSTETPQMIKMMTQDEAEQADFYICTREGEGDPDFFPDNQTGSCAHCGHAIYFRPHAPKQPTKICVQCAADLARASDKPVH